MAASDYPGKREALAFLDAYTAVPRRFLWGKRKSVIVTEGEERNPTIYYLARKDGRLRCEWVLEPCGADEMNVAWERWATLSNLEEVHDGTFVEANRVMMHVWEGEEGIGDNKPMESLLWSKVASAISRA